MNNPKIRKWWLIKLVMLALTVGLLAPRWYGRMLENIGMRYLVHSVWAFEPRKPRLFWQERPLPSCPTPSRCEIAYNWLARSRRYPAATTSLGYFLGLAAALSNKTTMAEKIWASGPGNHLFETLSYFELGHLLAQRERRDKARAWWRRGNAGPLLLKQALTRAREGAIDKALTLLDDAVAVDPDLQRSARPDLVTLYGLVGKMWMQRRAWDRAVEAYRHALTLAPDQDEYRIFLAYALRRLQRIDEAEQVLREATQSTSAHWRARAWLALGDLWRAQARWPEATTAYEKATQIEPHNRSYWRRLADAYRHQGMMKKAEEILQRLQGHQ